MSVRIVDNGNIFCPLSPNDRCQGGRPDMRHQIDQGSRAVCLQARGEAFTNTRYPPRAEQSTGVALEGVDREKSISKWQEGIEALVLT